MRFQRLCIALAGSLLIALIGGGGGAFLLTPLRGEPSSPWLYVADLGSLPVDGTPVLVKVEKPRRDAWVRQPDDVLGHVYLRWDAGTNEAVVLSRLTTYGCLVVYDDNAQVFRDPCRTWVFDKNGKCEVNASYLDLVKLPVMISGGGVYIVFTPPGGF